MVATAWPLALPVLISCGTLLPERSIFAFPTKSSTASTSTTMSPIDEALAYIDSLGEEAHINITQISERFKCNRSYLSKRYRGLAGTRHTQYQKQRNLNDQQEKTLVKYIDRLYANGLSPSKRMIQNFAQEICQKEIGKC